MLQKSPRDAAAASAHARKKAVRATDTESFWRELARNDRKHIRAIEKAFERFQLDVKKRADWDCLRTIVLGKRGQHRPKGTHKWNKHRLYFLGAVLSIFEPKFPNANLTELAAEIKKAVPANKNENPDSFRKRLGTARRMFERLLQEDGLSASQWLWVAADALDPETQKSSRF